MPKPLKLDHDEVYALEDIFDDMGRAWSDRVVEKNVKYLLEREKLLPRGWQVSIVKSTTDKRDAGRQDTTDRYGAKFEVFADRSTIAYTGVVVADSIKEDSRGKINRVLLSIEVYSLKPWRSGLERGFVIES